MDEKQLGTMKRSRRLPRRVREARVSRSKRYHLWQTIEAELRQRTSDTAEIMLDRMTSGRSFIVVMKAASASASAAAAAAASRLPRHEKGRFRVQ